jgi:hypothetical protein
MGIPDPISRTENRPFEIGVILSAAQGFFHISSDNIVFQRGYWDEMTFLRLRDLMIPHELR